MVTRPLRPLPPLCPTIYQLHCFRKSTPLQNRQPTVLISNSKQYVDNFAGELNS